MADSSSLGTHKGIISGHISIKRGSFFVRKMNIVHVFFKIITYNNKF